MNITGIELVDDLIYKHLHRSYMKDLKPQLNFDENSKQLKGMRFTYPFDKGEKYDFLPKTNLEYYIVKPIEPNYDTKLHQFFKQHHSLFVSLFYNYFTVSLTHFVDKFRVDIKEQQKIMEESLNLFKNFFEQHNVTVASYNLGQSQYNFDNGRRVSQINILAQFMGSVYLHDRLLVKQLVGCGICRAHELFSELLCVKYSNSISNYYRGYIMERIKLRFHILGVHRPDDYPIFFYNKKEILEELDKYPTFEN